jgi:EAL domain-containing protein (putative c-di-GMP-specific phosphodiesterase class I)
VILEIGEWVLERACADLVRLGETAPVAHGLNVSVNVAARQLAEPGFAGVVAAALRRSGLDPGRLTLEITESGVIDGTRAVTATLEEIRALGARVFLDDFGTGYSSLCYLQRLPIDGLKIDRSFVARLATDPAQRAIVGAVVSMARAIRLGLVGEGVERAEQAVQLRDLGCDVAQGYAFARPARFDKVAALLLRDEEFAARRRRALETAARAGSDRTGPVT